MPSASSNSPPPLHLGCGKQAHGGHLLWCEGLLVGAAEEQVELAGASQEGIPLCVQEGKGEWGGRECTQQTIAMQSMLGTSI